MNHSPYDTDQSSHAMDHLPQATDQSPDLPRINRPMLRIIRPMPWIYSLLFYFFITYNVVRYNNIIYELNPNSCMVKDQQDNRQQVIAICYGSFATGHGSIAIILYATDHSPYDTDQSPHATDHSPQAMDTSPYITMPRINRSMSPTNRPMPRINRHMPRIIRLRQRINRPICHELIGLNVTDLFRLLNIFRELCHVN